jgi:hypothetical protein
MILFRASYNGRRPICGGAHGWLATTSLAMARIRTEAAKLRIVPANEVSWDDLLAVVGRVAVPHHGNDLGSIDQCPSRLALQANQPIRAELDAGRRVRRVTTQYVSRYP